MKIIFEKVIKSKEKVKLFDINEYISPSKIDGLHYDEEGHKIFAEKILEFLDQNNFL